MIVLMNSIKVPGATEDQLKRLQRLTNDCREYIHDLHEIYGITEAEIKFWYEEREMP